MSKKWTIVLCIVCAGAFFYLGMLYKGSTTPSGLAGRGAGAFSSSTFAGRGGGANFTGGGALTGQVLSKDAQSLTVQLPSGNSEVVFYSSSTSVVVPSPSSISTVNQGANVTITGTQNSDGSFVAQSIQVRTGNGGGSAGR